MIPDDSTVAAQVFFGLWLAPLGYLVHIKPTVFMGAIAEGWMVLYLLVKGVQSSSVTGTSIASVAPAR